MMRRTRSALMVAALIVSLAMAFVSPAQSDENEYGVLTFPADEHAKVDGLDYWWGAADVMTTAGNHYTVSMAYTGFSSYAVVGHELFAHQGPYEGLSVLSESGPAEWGHPEQTPGEFVTTLSNHVEGVSDLLVLETRSTLQGGKVIDRFERTSLDEPTYRFRVDNDAADLHPTDERIRWAVDLGIEMHDGPPLLAGGTGRWWYGLPETFGYPSRSFQYMQASREVTGMIELEQPDGSVLVETIDPTQSNYVMIHEYDASPEDIPGGLGAAQATQMHPRYAQYYQGGMPWEIVFVDLDNGAQLMLAVMAFHFTEEGTMTDVVEPDMPTYRILATLRLPTGESVALDDDLLLEHLSYRELVGRVPTAFVAVWGHMIQTWESRVGHPGGTYTAGDGSSVDVPPFDITLQPALDSRMPAIDANGNGLTQRVPFRTFGQWDGCPTVGAGWSELIINWHGRTHKDPWYTGGDVTPVPDACGEPVVDVRDGNGRPLTPTPDQQGEPTFEGDGCQAYDPGVPTCTYTATADGGIAGYASEPSGWTVTITRPGRAEPIVVNGTAGSSFYACGIIQPGDLVEATAHPGSGVMPGNPTLCSEGNVFDDSNVRLLPGPTSQQVRVSTPSSPDSDGSTNDDGTSNPTQTTTDRAPGASAEERNAVETAAAAAAPQSLANTGGGNVLPIAALLALLGILLARRARRGE